MKPDSLPFSVLFPILINEDGMCFHCGVSRIETPFRFSYVGRKIRFSESVTTIGGEDVSPGRIACEIFQEERKVFSRWRRRGIAGQGVYMFQ